MKSLAIILLLSLAACGRESSPDGRSQMRDENIQKEVDSLKNQNKALQDSITVINKELSELKHK